MKACGPVFRHTFLKLVFASLLIAIFPAGFEVLNYIICNCYLLTKVDCDYTLGTGHQRNGRLS